MLSTVSTYGAASIGSQTLFQLYSKSLAVRSVPSDHFKPSLKWKVQVRPFLLVSHFSAWPGAILPSLSTVKRHSKLWSSILPPSTALFKAGSMVSGFGPIWTERIFSPVLLSVFVPASSFFVSPSLLPFASSFVVCELLSLESSPLPQAARPKAIVTASNKAITFFFIFFPPSFWIYKQHGCGFTPISCLSYLPQLVNMMTGRKMSFFHFLPFRRRLRTLFVRIGTSGAEPAAGRRI